MRYKSIFSYMGGKGKMAHHYPRPQFGRIIEPFAGAGAYSFHHVSTGFGGDVWLNDLDPKTHAIWTFLTSPDAQEIFQAWVPPVVEAGQTITELLDGYDDYPGLRYLMQAEANQGTQGGKGVHDQITSMGAKCWPIFVKKIPTILPLVRDWKVTNLPYNAPEFNDGATATWFIDPPYSNAAGARYRQASTAIEYGALAEWCRSRKGQVIVCENEGADWLPFQPIDHKHLSIRSRYQRASAREVMWTNDEEWTFNGKPIFWEEK